MDFSVSPSLTYVDGTLWQAVRSAAERFSRLIAYDFMGKSTSYRQFARDVEQCAKALISLGVRPGDRVTVCLPNCPQAVVLFYAVNAVGGVANMVHPLSGEKEIEFFLRESESKIAVTLNQFYGKFEEARKNVSLDTLIITSIKDALSFPMKIGYALTEQSKIPPLPNPAPVLLWKDFLKRGDSVESFKEHQGKTDDPAVILYSGGTTGTTKGVLLSNGNFNALAQQVLATNPMFRPGDTMLAVMPVFHGFGLGISIHSMLFNGGRCLLVPRFTVKSYAGLLMKKRCNFIAGVPSLYEALLREDSMKRADLSSLKGVFSGGDTLSVELKKRLDRFLADHRATVTVREGYGTTECVTASCLTPENYYKEGSIGIPFPDTYYKIVRPESQEEVPVGELGEICLCGPTVMLGYLNRPEETAAVLQRHGDGNLWVHTGDLGKMDEDGFVYFCQRIKRVIVSNGYNIYPSRIENVLDGMDEVQISCVIGVPDPIRGQRVKAFVVLKEGIPADETTEKILMEHCGKYIAKYALPKQIEFRPDLPKTAVGKVAYRLLEEEHNRE